jgi:galactosyl transferase GMA12/MNN10 family
MEDRNNNNLSSFMNENKRICLENGMHYIFLEKTSFHVPPYWGKVFELNKLMKENPRITYFMWLDSDAFFINFDKKRLENFLHKYQYYSMLISKDMPPWGGVFNAGSFIVKNDERGRGIMKEWISNYNPNKWTYANSKWTTPSVWAGEDYEQGSFIKHILNSTKYNKYIVQLPYQFLNNNNCIDNTTDTITTHLAAEHKNNYFTVQKCLNIFNPSKEKIVESFGFVKRDPGLRFIFNFIFVCIIVALILYFLPVKK